MQKIFSDLKTEQNSYQELGITYDEKAFYDILISVAEKHQFKEQLSEDKYIYLAKEIKKLVANKSKYTDWTNRQDVKDELYICLLYTSNALSIGKRTVKIFAVFLYLFLGRDGFLHG